MKPTPIDLVCLRALTVALAVFTGSALAHNVTLSGSFDGTEPRMKASSAECPPGTELGYEVLGEIQAETAADYRFADVGDVLHYELPASEIADLLILIYDGPFDPVNPAINRHAVVDSWGDVALQPGTYTVVVQHWCNDQANQPGAFAVLINVDGTLTGAGFASPPETMGSWDGINRQADFPGYGSSRYAEMAPIRIDRSAYYYFADMYLYRMSNDFLMAVYEGDFNPADPEANLLAILDDADGVFLEAGEDYVFVPFDGYDQGGNWQYVWFPPGPMNFNAGLNASWYNPQTSGQGIFLDVGPESGFVFFSVFTYEVAGVALSDTAVLGSADQRWLTAYGVAESGADIVAVQFENSTGGAFNRPKSQYPVDTDSSYGTGLLEAVDCNRLNLNYELPGGLSGSMEMVRVLPDPPELCASLVPAGPVTE